MTINVYKSDFSLFEGLYNAVIYQKSRITRICKNFIEVDFGPEHMNPYVIMNHKNIKGYTEYKHIMEMCCCPDIIDIRLLDEIYTLFNRYTLTTDEIMRRINSATCYPVGHIHRTVL
jgi:hypothetical protein